MLQRSVSRFESVGGPLLREKNVQEDRVLGNLGHERG